MKTMTVHDIQALREQYLSEPLFCTFVEVLDTLECSLDGLTSVEIWTCAKETFANLQKSPRPDLRISGLCKELSAEYGSDETAAIIMICVLYMICSSDKPDAMMAVCARKITAMMYGSALMDFIYEFQRKAELREEELGNPVPESYYAEGEDAANYLWDSVITNVPTFDMLQPDLRSCIADTERFGEYCHKINRDILPYVKSEEGCSQMWKAVLLVSKELKYISRKCSVTRFSLLLAAICPEAGDAKLLDQNMQKYIKKECDLIAIQKRFGAIGSPTDDSYSNPKSS
ncbi:MAG: hypothetical protein KBS80_09165 [Bacteroidales bacterium]|nr:hypothetical protein [Candidatus Cryptobacteroides choladohippi]